MTSTLKPIGFAFAGIMVGASIVQVLHAQGAPSRVELQRHDLTGASDTEVIVATLEVPPGAKVPRHFHHGDEVLYVLEGGSFQAPGQDPTILDAGMTLHFTRNEPHGGFTVVGDKAIKVLTVHIVDKGKPLVEPVE